MEIQERVPLAPHTTFDIGGSASFFVEVSKVDDLSKALDYAEVRNLPFQILAGGSNMLISDEGYEGLVIKIAFDKCGVYNGEKEVEAEAGCPFMGFIEKCTEAGLSGMESMYGIPGSVGGAVRGNAGAFGTEIKDSTTKVTALHAKTREVRTFSNEDCTFAYRDSFFKQNPEWIVLSACFELSQSTAPKCLEKTQHILDERNARQIQDIRSAGSFFMNPRAPEAVQQLFADEKGTKAREGRVPAGWLIDKAGFKDACENAICTGKRSANYFINTDGASAKDAMALASKIKEAVAKQFGIELQEEITKINLQ